ncbi:MAG TPA: 30S ribosomal protein S3ae [Thermoprotei archaeon]|nr:30S ribosomal protein S3ae [Thermoprotei archaeon]
MCPVRRARKGKKKYYLTVKAPPVLGGIELLPIITTDPNNAIGRHVEVLLADITGDFKHQFIKVKLKIVAVKDGVAETIYSGHEYFREYERSLIMRGTSYVKAIRDVTTKDGYRYRIRVGVFTTKRITNSRKKAIRRYVFKVLDEWAKKTDNETFIKDMLFGNIDEEIKKVSRKVYPIREGTGIMKVKLIAIPEKKEVLERA